MSLSSSIRYKCARLRPSSLYFTLFRTISTPPAASSRQNVTLPVIPELFDPNFLDFLLPNAESQTHYGPQITSRSLAIDASTLGDKIFPLSTSTRSPTLVAFEALRSRTRHSSLWKLLDKAWEEDASLTLKLIWKSRSIIDGKGLNKVFYSAYGWLYENHPRTAILNLPQLVEPVCQVGKSNRFAPHGYWKDYLNILSLAVMKWEELPSMKRKPNIMWPYYSVENISGNHYGFRSRIQWRPRIRWRFRNQWRVMQEWRPRGRCRKQWRPKKSLEELDHRNTVPVNEKMTQTISSPHDSLTERLSDPKFRALYIGVAQLFANKLLQDTDMLYRRLPDTPEGEERDNLIRQISLAAKWAPTPGGAHDRRTNISTAIATLVHHSKPLPLQPPQIIADLEQGFPPLEAHILRSYYQRWILTPLREITCVPERLMSANRWKEINYTRASSKCIQRNARRFYDRDPCGFRDYLASIEGSKKLISSTTLLPHDLLNDSIALYRDTQHVRDPKRPSLKDYKKTLAEKQINVMDAQWRNLIDRFRKSGTLDNTIGICDISGSMGTLYNAGRRRKEGFIYPFFSAVSLSMIFNQLSKPPFRDHFITFSDRPELIRFDPSKSLPTIAYDLFWGRCGPISINLKAVFLLHLLPLALKHQVKEEDMIKRIFVFSDAPFDEARGLYTHWDVNGPDAWSPGRLAEVVQKGIAEWEADYDVIEKAYRKAGYEVPEIVYWNLSRRAATGPPPDYRKGVTYMNGFSRAMLRDFLGEGKSQGSQEGQSAQRKKLDSIEAMKASVEKKSFEGLVVVD